MLLTVVLATSFSFTACSSDDDGVVPEPKTEDTLEKVIVGSWQVIGFTPLIFEKDGRYGYYVRNEQGSTIEYATYKIDGNKLTLNDYPQAEEPQEFSFREGPDKVTLVFTVLSFDDETMVTMNEKGLLYMWTKLD